MRVWVFLCVNKSRSLTVSSVPATLQYSQCQELVWDCISVAPLSKHMEDGYGLRARYGKARRFHSVCLVRRKRNYLWWFLMMEQELFDQRDMTILIVDDEARIRDFVR